MLADRRGRALRVAYIAPSFHPAYSYGGPTESSYQLTRYLARSGCEVRVLTTNADGPDRELEVETGRDLELESGLRVRYCRRQALAFVSPQMVSQLSRYVRWADVIHLDGVYSFPTIPTLVASSAHRRPVVMTTRGQLQRWENVRRARMKDAWEGVCRVIGPRRLGLHFTSTEERDESAGRFPSALVAMIPNGVLVPSEPPSPVPSDTLRMLTLGRLHPIKGIDNLLAACGALRDDGFGPFSLTLAGLGDRAYTEQLQQRIAELSLEAVVTLAGEVRGDAKTRLFAHSDVLLAPSFRENFGNAIAEALAHGLPVIAGKGTPWSGLETHDAGLWVKNDPVTLAAAIARAAAMPRREMGARGRAWVARELSWERVASEMRAVYERLMHPS